MLKDKVSLFIPEVCPVVISSTAINAYKTTADRSSKLPGYGLSSPTKSTSRSAVGAALLEASHSIFPDRPIILGGHDRGARMCHRLAISHVNPPKDTAELHSYKLLGTVLLDIVPTLVQWQSFSNPVASATYFHWPFLTSPVAVDMIDAWGGDKWCHNSLDRVCGDNSAGRKACQSDDAWSVYESQFKKRECIEGSCADYVDGMNPEPQEQEKDQKAGRKIDVPTLVMWSLGKLGKMHGDVEGIWKQWVKDGVDLRAQGCGEDVGHYLPEEAHEVVGKAIIKLLDEISS